MRRLAHRIARGVPQTVGAGYLQAKERHAVRVALVVLRALLALRAIRREEIETTALRAASRRRLWRRQDRVRA